MTANRNIYVASLFNTQEQHIKLARSILSYYAISNKVFFHFQIPAIRVFTELQNKQSCDLPDLPHTRFNQSKCNSKETKTTTIATIKPQRYRNTAAKTWQQTETLISHDSSMLKNGLLDQFEAIFLNWTRFFLLQKSRDKRILWTVKQTDLPDFPQTRFNQSKCSRKKERKTHNNCNNNQIRVLQKHSNNYTKPPSDALDLSLLFPPASHRVRPSCNKTWHSDQ